MRDTASPSETCFRQMKPYAREITMGTQLCCWHKYSEEDYLPFAKCHLYICRLEAQIYFHLFQGTGLRVLFIVKITFFSGEEILITDMAADHVCLESPSIAVKHHSEGTESFVPWLFETKALSLGELFWMLLGIQSFMLIRHIYIETYNCRII